MARKPTKAQVLEAIYDSGGIIDEIARRLGVAWATARSYIEKWDETKQAYDIENERVLDLAEMTVITKIKDGDEQTAKWILSRKGKKRGYGDNVDVTSGGEKIGKDSDELKSEILRKLDSIATAKDAGAVSKQPDE